MKINGKGQVTIPAHLPASSGLHQGDEVDVIDDGGSLRTERTERTEASQTRGQRLAARMRGRGHHQWPSDALPSVEVIAP